MPELPVDDYVSPPFYSFWTWDDDGVATWRDGSTIAFPDELEDLVDVLAPRGLPLLTVIVIVEAACRDSWFQAVRSPANRESLKRWLASAHGLTRGQVRGLRRGLTRVARLPAELRHPIEARRALIDFVTETIDVRLSRQNSESILNWGLQPTPERTRMPAMEPGHDRHLGLSLIGLLDGLNRLDEPTLRLRQRTGLDQLVQPANIDFAGGDHAQRSLRLLLHDPELRGLGRVVSQLLAAVRLPRSRPDREELPVGGYADITHRGALDRLLISELAYDNLTLAMRVAMQEALYHRREVPEDPHDLPRCVLLDVGVRMWGVNRLFATAVGLALALTAGRGTSATLYRARRDGLEPADLTTRWGLLQHLTILETYAHLGEFLAPFWRISAGGATGIDRIIVTSAAAAADRSFQQALADWQNTGCYVATVNADGEFHLLRPGKHGTHILCEATLDLDALLEERGRPTVAVLDNDAAALPVILQQTPFPLRVSNLRFNADQSWVIPGYGAFEVTSDHRLVWWDAPGKQPRQLGETISSSAPICWSDTRIRQGRALAVLAQDGNLGPQLLTVDIVTGQITLIPLQLRGHCCCITGHGGMIFGVADYYIHMLSAHSGKSLDSAHFVALLYDREDLRLGRRYHIVHAMGRFFHDATRRHWRAAAYDGLRMHIEPIAVAPVPLAAMFDQREREGPIGVTEDGRLWFPEDDQLLPIHESLDGQVQVLDVSPSGHWLNVRHGHDNLRREACVAVSLGRSEYLPTRRNLRAQEALAWVLPANRTFQTDFTAICGQNQTRLVLLARNHAVWTMTLVDGVLRLWEDRALSPASFPQARKFDQELKRRAGAYRLAVARWPNGSQAVLDSRGLLHLRSSNPADAEITIVLARGESGGWCSNGSTWGPADLLLDAANTKPGEIFQHVLVPFLARVS